MAVKVLVTAIGQHLIADVKQVEDSETNEVVAYWLKDTQIINYQPTESGQIGIQMGNYCPIANNHEFSLRRDHVVAILDPREDVLNSYVKLIEQPEVNLVDEDDAIELDSTEE